LKMIEIRHSLIASSSIKDLLAVYDIGEIVGCDFLTRGLNDTYVVNTLTEKYIYRVYRKGWRNKEDILFELDAINHLYESGIPVSFPLKTKEGAFLTEIDAPEGTRYGTLFTYSKGSRPEINKENCTFIGKALGAIHKATDSFKPKHVRSFEINLTHLCDEPMELIIPTVQKCLGEKQVSYIKQLTSKLKDLIKNTEYHFCHGDFHNFNMHISDNIIEAFDFDCCGMGYRAYDMAVFWWNLKQNYPSMEETCWDAFLNGYLTMKNMNTDDLLKFVTLRRIWFMGTLLKNDDVWGTQWINETNLLSFMKQLERDGAI
jgi:Ser/Thr protein kinase RdoA (MazF antagonist)